MSMRFGSAPRVLSTTPAGTVDGVEHDTFESPRIAYRPLSSAHRSAFHALVADAHVREYLFDGNVMPEAWVQDTIAECETPFRESRVGLWLLFERRGSSHSTEPFGFAGFWLFESLGAEPQLLYALKRSRAGRGLATEAAATMIRFARGRRLFSNVSAAVDAPNVASIRVLTKLGFHPTGTADGQFGHTALFGLPKDRPAAVLHSKRLTLRPWKDSDREPFASMNADAEVMRLISEPLSRTESDALAARIERHFSEHGYGLWAVEERGGAPFVGFVGLSKPNFTAHFTPCVEVGWRIARPFWGRGFATEGAAAAIDAAFSETGIDTLVSFTVPTNTRSRRVMEKLGMTHDPADNFDHPSLPLGHPLRAHVLYRLVRSIMAGA